MLNIALSIIVLCSAAACDFVRSVAGRPTSADIDAKRQAIAVVEARKQAAADSAIRVQKYIADSLSVMDSIASRKIVVKGPSEMGGFRNESDMSGKYGVVIGAFSMEENAHNLLSKAEAAGYHGTVLHFRRTLLAVLIGPEDRVRNVYDTYNRLLDEPFCPENAWILQKDKP